MSEYIFISVYPNTEGKIQTLKECIHSLRKTRFPIVLVSNMRIPIEVSSLADDFILGENSDCNYDDFFTREEIDKARNLCKYILHFTPYGGETISYNSFSYGRGSTYHWSALTQHNLILNYLEDKSVTNFFSMEGDMVISESDLHLIEENFTLMMEEELDFIVPIQHNLEHIGSPFFLSYEYWKKVCSGFSKKNFLETTYPSWSAESYVLERMKNSGGRGKILIWEGDSFNFKKCPNEWIITTKKIQGDINFLRSANLFFPDTLKIDLSSSIDRRDQNPSDPLQYIQMGIGEKLNVPVFFIWNRYNGETVKKIKAKVSIYNGEFLIFDMEYNLLPDHWSWSPIYNMKKNSHCTVDILTTDTSGNNLTFSDKFGFVGDSINIRDIINE